MRFKNLWDQIQTLTGSVYGNPAYGSGPETGDTIYDSPATKYFTASQGAPARHVNYVLRQNGENAIQSAQHAAMHFRGQGVWAPTCGAASKTNDGFLIGSTASVTFHRDGVLAHGFAAMTPAVSAFALVHDDGFHIIGAEGNGASGEVHFASASTVSATAGFTGTNYPLTAVTVSTSTMLLATSGTAIKIFTFPNSSVTPAIAVVSVAGTLNSSSTSIWGAAQSSTSSGSPAILYSKGIQGSSAQYLRTLDGLSCSAYTLSSTPADNLADIAYDDVQGAFVACFYSSTGSTLKFMQSTDGITWTTSATAAGPSSNPFVTGSPTLLNNVAFKITSGIWFAASTNFQPNNFVYGLSGTAASQNKRVFGFYSLDFGQTWFSADLDMSSCTSGTTLRIKTLDRKFMVFHDSDVSVSGPIGIPTQL